MIDVKALMVKTVGAFACNEMNKQNVRYANRNLRVKHRNRLKAMDAPCGICHGLLGPIHYDEPSDHNHPLSFVIDEKIPISKARLYGYDSPRQAAEDWNNLQAAHYYCNACKGNKTNFSFADGASDRKKGVEKKINISDGDW